jgi:hypothetical protein
VGLRRRKPRKKPQLSRVGSIQKVESIRRVENILARIPLPIQIRIVKRKSLIQRLFL